jgi:protein CpxP
MRGRIIGLATPLLALLALGLAAAVPLAGQRPPPREERAALEGRFRQRLAEVVQKRLALTDEQMRRLAATNREYDERRRLLLQQERDARMALRDEILAGERADQARVAELLERMLQVQRQRIDLVDEEQRDLAAFMTPVQRAKYLAMQDELRRRMEELRRERRDRRRGPLPEPGRRPSGGTTKTP